MAKQSAAQARPASPEVSEKRYKGRMGILKLIEARDIPISSSGSELLKQELRIRIRDRNYRGQFLPMVCDHCYSELWKAQENKLVACPGCGWSIGSDGRG